MQTSIKKWEKSGCYYFSGQCQFSYLKDNLAFIPNVNAVGAVKKGIFNGEWCFLQEVSKKSIDLLRRPDRLNRGKFEDVNSVLCRRYGDNPEVLQQPRRHWDEKVGHMQYLSQNFYRFCAISVFDKYCHDRLGIIPRILKTTSEM